MSAWRSTSWKLVLAAGILLTLVLGVIGCGGGDSGTTAITVPTATIQGSVSGTIVMAIDETGKIVDQDDTTGKTPLPGTSPPRYPFTLTVPVGHQYRIMFIVDEGTSSQQIVPLALGSSDIFSVSSTGTINLGYVDTSQETAVADNTSMLVPAGESGPQTVLVDGARYLILLDNTDGSKRYRAQIQLKNPDNTVLTNRSLVRDMKVYDNTWTELAQNGSFFFWDGTSIAQNPQSDVEVYLQASPGSLAPGFYSVVLTDNNGNLYTTPVWHGTPAEVSKPTNLQQLINQDNSITLTWGNPTNIPAGREAEYFLMAHVLCNDQNADGVLDSLYYFSMELPTSSHTIPASVVSSVLSGKPGLRWRVEVRQRTPDPISYPDGYVALAQIYRTYSAEATLNLPSPSLSFTQADLVGEWDLMEFTTFDVPPGGGWFRLVVRIDENGHLFVDDNTTYQSAGSGFYISNGDSGLVLTINSAGVVSSTGSLTTSNMPPGTDFHGNMSSSKQLIVATGSWSLQGVTGRNIWVARKRVPGLTYGASDLANKSFSLHTIESGAVKGWSRGTGTIDGSLQVRLTSMVEDPPPSTPEPVDPNLVVEQLQIDGNGLVSAGSNPTFKGFLTADKTTAFLVNTFVEGSSTSFELVAISLVNPVKTFTLADLAGTYRFHNIWTSPAGWAYGTVVMGSAGSGTISGTEPAGSWDPIPITLSISSDGTVRVTNMDETFHGTLSPNGDLLISTVTDSFGYGEYSLGIMVK